MKSDSQFLTILEKLNESAEKIAKIETHVEILRFDVAGVLEEDKVQNKLLDEHIRGTVDNRSRLNLEIEVRKTVESRLEKLERFPKYLKSTYQILIYAGMVLGIVYEAGRILHKW